MNTMNALEDLTRAGEAEWLERWAVGPTELEPADLPSGAMAPDLALLDHDGRKRQLSEFWAGQPALVMFWRHFGCWCGFTRAERLVADAERYRAAGLNLVVVAQGEPERAAAYRVAHELPCDVLCDPDHVAYRAYGIGHWQIERILPDAGPELWDHDRAVGESFQAERRALGRPLVDDPWRAVKEFVVGPDGRVRLTYAYQHCQDFHVPQVLITAARLSQSKVS